MKHNVITVGLTYDLAADYTLKPGDPKDLFSEFDNMTIVRGICKAIEKLGYNTEFIGGFDSVFANITKIKQSIDIIFNTAEGLRGRNREAEIPILLEHFGIPYLGSDALSMSLTLDKVMTKKILLAESIPTPAFIVTDTPLTQKSLQPLAFPLIVKPQWEGSSKGMTAKSKVYDLAGLNKQVQYISLHYHQPSLIEAFITGRECTVALVGNGSELTAYPPLEIRIRKGIVGDKIFVGRYVYSNDVTYDCPAKFPAPLTEQIINLAKKTYAAVGCLDFGRVDFRIDEHNHPYVLEINPLPALSKQDSFGSIAKSLSVSYDAMIQKILQTALKRYHIL